MRELKEKAKEPKFMSTDTINMDMTRKAWFDVQAHYHKERRMIFMHFSCILMMYYDMTGRGAFWWPDLVVAETLIW